MVFLKVETRSFPFTAAPYNDPCSVCSIALASCPRNVTVQTVTHSKEVTLQMENNHYAQVYLWCDRIFPYPTL